MPTYEVFINLHMDVEASSENEAKQALLDVLSTELTVDDLIANEIDEDE